VLGPRAKNCNTGNILDQEQVVAAKRKDVLNSYSQIVRKFRTTVGESLATVERQLLLCRQRHPRLIDKGLSTYRDHDLMRRMNTSPCILSARRS
jgi:hypothetical protein